VADVEYDAVEDEAARADRGEPAVGAGSESARAGRCASCAARADPPFAADALAGEGEPAEQVVAFFGASPVSRWWLCPSWTGCRWRSVYQGRRLVRAITRWRRDDGDDVTVLARALIDGIPARVERRAGSRCVARR